MEQNLRFGLVLGRPAIIKTIPFRWLKVAILKLPLPLPLPLPLLQTAIMEIRAIL